MHSISSFGRNHMRYIANALPILLVVGLGVVLANAPAKAQEGDGDEARTAQRPNILFLTVDTLRADRLGAYGYEYDTTPNLDVLAEAGMVFTNAVCEVPLTAPSFGSMFASQYPRMTGMTRNGLRIPEETPLVAEQFQAAGYQTLCVQSNWTLKSDRKSVV